MNDAFQRIMEVPPYIKVKDAKIYFGLAERAVWQHIARNEIAASKDGKHWIVNTASVFKFLKRRQNIHKED